MILGSRDNQQAPTRNLNNLLHHFADVMNKDEVQNGALRARRRRNAAQEPRT